MLVDFANNELSLRLADRFLALQVLALDTRAPVARAVDACNELEDLLARAYAAAHAVLDRSAAEDRGRKGGRKTHVASDELKNWAVRHLGSVPTNLKTAKARAQWLINKAPAAIRSAMPTHNFDDPERVVREHLSLLVRRSKK